MSSQEAFLARVQQALHRESLPAPQRPPLLWREQPVTEAVKALQERLATRRPELLLRVQQELEAVGGVVARVSSVAEAVAYVTHLARDTGAKLVARWQSDLLERLEIDAALQQHGVAVHPATLPSEPSSTTATSAATATRRRELRDLLARADLGLSGVDYVIAETGTLVLTARPGQMRSVSLLPPVHVAVARADQVVATLADTLLLLQASGVDLQQQLTSCISFITGPSRTGDIELKLTIGVHGPGALHLVLLDEGSGAC